MTETAQKDTIVRISDPDPDGTCQVARLSKDGVRIGKLVPVKDGQSVGEAELLLVENLTQDGVVMAAETIHHPQGRGPAMVNSESYKNGWDVVFGKKGAPKALN